MNWYGNRNCCTLHFCCDLLPLNNFLLIWSRETIFGVDKHLDNGLSKMCEKFLSDVQKPPKSSEISDTESLVGPKFWTKFCSQNCPEVKTGKKSRQCVKKFSNVYFQCSDNFEWWRNFYIWATFWLVGRIFSKMTTPSKWSKIIIFNIWWFFLSFWANWAKLPTFP